MPVATAIAAGAASQADLAQAEAHAAHVEACKATMPKYNAQTATVAEMRNYAECVGEVYPKEISPDVAIALKVLFVIALLGLAGGVVWSWREERWDGWITHIGVGIAGFFVAPCIVAFFGAVLWGVWWLFS